MAMRSTGFLLQAAGLWRRDLGGGTWARRSWSSRTWSPGIWAGA